MIELDDFDEALKSLKAKRPTPKNWSAEQWADQLADVRNRAFFSAKVSKREFLDRAQLFIANFMARNLDEDGRLLATGPAKFVEVMHDFAVREGMGNPGVPLSLLDEDDITDVRSSRRLLLIFNTNVRTAAGFGAWKQAMIPAVLDAFPAARFVRLPGALDPRPRHSQGEGDVRLKSDFAYWATWQNSRDIGGFQNPYEPFGYNSFMTQQDVSRAEAKEMGLLADESKIRPKGAELPTLNDKLSVSIKRMSPEMRKKLREELGTLGVFSKGRVSLRKDEPAPKPKAKVVVKVKPKAKPKAKPSKTASDEWFDAFMSGKGTGYVPPKPKPKPKAPALPPVTLSDAPIKISGKVSDGFTNGYRKALGAIPRPLVDKLIDDGVEFNAAEYTTTAMPHLKGVTPRGWHSGRTWDEGEGLYNPLTKMVLASQNIIRNGESKIGRPVQAIVLHETGHAFDDVAGLSWSKAFTDAHEEDKKTAPLGLAGLEYFTQEGNAGREETIAEGFAIAINENESLKGLQGDALFFKSTFPRSMKLIRATIEKLSKP